MKCIEQEISFRLNGKSVCVSVLVTMDTLSLLRDVLGLTGTKYGCGEGECGACTILVDGMAVNACLMFAVDCDGRELTTIEGVRSEDGMSVLQRRVCRTWGGTVRILHTGADHAGHMAFESGHLSRHGADQTRYRGQPVPLHRVSQGR